MTKVEMMNEVITNRGFEDRFTIGFCDMCENPIYSVEVLESLMNRILSLPLDEEEDF